MNTAIEERIRTRAYELWEAEGRPEGREVDHWLKAAQELADERERSTVAAAPRARKPAGTTATPAKRTAATTAKRTATTAVPGARSRSPKRTSPVS